MGYCPRCTAEHEMLEAQLLADIELEAELE
jgi:hypothetical protein